MANENAVLTYETIHGWSAADLRKHLADPAERAVIDKIVADHAAEVIAKAGEQNEAQRDREARRLEAQKAREAADLQAQKDADLEHERQVRLTPAERQVERAAAQEREREEEAKAREDQIKKEKLEAYLQGSGIPLDAPKEVRDAEIKRRKDEYAAKVAADEAAAEAKAKEEAEAPQKEAEAKAAAEAAQKAAEEKVAADAAEAEKKALEEKQRLAAEEAAKPKQKIVEDFQAEDENGNPIGRRTHLEADTEEEMRAKIKDSYIHAIRYAERMKKRADMKPTPLPAAQEPILVLTDESRKAIEEDLKSKDATVAATAKAKLDLDNIQKANQAALEVVEDRRQNAESLRFCEIHKDDFYPCQANAGALYKYMHENNLYWDVNNLEIAFSKLEPKLAPRPIEVPDPAVVAAEAKARADAEAQAAAAKAAADAKVLVDAEAERKRIEQEKAAANTAPASASVVVPAAASAAAVTPTPAETPAAAGNPPASATKLPAGGIEPGTLHGGRPVPGTATKPTGLTKQEVARMAPDVFKKRLKDPNFRKQLNDLGIRA